MSNPTCLETQINEYPNFTSLIQGGHGSNSNERVTSHSLETLTFLLTIGSNFVSNSGHYLFLVCVCRGLPICRQCCWCILSSINWGISKWLSLNTDLKSQHLEIITWCWACCLTDIFFLATLIVDSKHSAFFVIRNLVNLKTVIHGMTHMGSNDNHGMVFYSEHRKSLTWLINPGSIHELYWLNILAMIDF